MIATPTFTEVLLPVAITVVTVILTKGSDTLFTSWSSKRANRQEEAKETAKQRREDRLRSERERDEWREKYYQEVEDHLETRATCVDHEKRLAEALSLLDRRKHTPATDELVRIEKKRKSDR